MDLAKHTTGQPLSEAEHRQRRNAARARWGTGAVVTGAVLGAAAGSLRSIDALPRETADRLREVDVGLVARSDQRAEAIGAAIRQRMRSRGTRANKLIYDYEIAGLQRQAKRAKTTAQAKQIADQIAGYERLKVRQPKPIARKGGARVKQGTKGGLSLLDAQIEAIEQHGLTPDILHLEAMRDQMEQEIAAPATKVVAHPERRFRGGDTQKRLDERIARAKKMLEARQSVLLDHLKRRTQQLRETARQQTIREIRAGLRSRLLRAGGKGALIGAGLGLTAAGIGMLVDHIASAADRRRSLAKAAPANPESSMANGMAETYRQWIDRLLGNSDKPIQFADDLIQAMGPGLTQAFAEGATQPPVDPPAGQPDGSEGPPYNLEVDFDRLNPAVRRHMANYALDRIVEISAQQRDAIRTALMEQSVLQGIGPRDVARTIRQSIGLTSYQINVVNGFRKKLEELDPAVFEMKLRDKRYDRTIERAIREDTPLTPDQINAMVDAYHRRMLALRAETIARTEAIRATSYGGVARAQDVMDQHPDLDCIKRWIATDDNRTRDTHRALNGKEAQGLQTQFETTAGNLIRWPVDQDAVADETINCLLPGTRVFAPELLAVSRRKFNGQVVTLEVADGSQLTVTSYHPILSERGWIAAQFLQEGCSIICSSRSDWTAKIDNDKHRHPRIEDIEHALRITGSPIASKIGMGMDFHGEGISGQIDVTIADYNLMDAYDAAFHQHIAENAFGGTDLVTNTLSRHSALCSPLSRFFTTSYAGMSSTDLHLALAVRHLRPFQSLGFAGCSQSAAIFNQGISNGTSRQIVALGQCVDRSAGIIKRQKLVGITRKAWSGHVYNLQTQSGIYLAENIGNHNCRCSLGFRFIPKAIQLQAKS